MGQRTEEVQSPAPPWVSGVTYTAALAAGVVLISSGQATPAEASGYVAPFLVLYERVISRR
ncbi:hypothetical protein GCM10010246_50580 [Streptomyces cuspidosporus]|uniref:Integral membrane protein n=1 Tax=Streptomyces cuspidosporus TaxID=66882 RepID=A0ABP5TMK2_9ACTN